MAQTVYRFKTCVGAMFEMSTADALRLLPPHLQPLEIQHTRSILAVMAFQFTDSEVGAYDEVVLSVVTPPRVVPGQAVPMAGFFPFMVGTSTEASRLHAIERWHLPHHMADLDFTFRDEDGRMEVAVDEGSEPVLRLTVTEHGFEPAVRPYHCFMVDGQERFKVNITMEALHSQHEDEKGSLVLFEHPMTQGLDFSEVATTPFREEWYRAGIQTFDQVERI